MGTSANTNIRWFVKKILPKPVVNFLRTHLPESLYYPSYGHTTLNDSKIKSILFLLGQCIANKLEADVIECGVFRGGSLIQMGLKLRELQSEKLIYGIDTFEGHPFNTSEDILEDGSLIHRKGLFSDTRLEKVQQVLKEKKLYNVKLIKGLVDEILPRFDKSEFCFAHFDLDLYKSTKQALSFIVPRMVKEGVICFDDYGDPETPGVKKAVDEILGSQSITVTLNSKNEFQAYWKKK